MIAESREFQPSGMGLFEWKPMFHLGPVAVQKPMVLCLLVMAGVVGFFWAAFSKPKLVPRGVQNLGELGYLFVRDQIARPMMGQDADRWMGLLLSLFFFIWMANLMAVLPLAQFPVNSHIAYPAVLAGLVYLTMWVVGVRHHGLVGFVKNATCPPGLPKPMYLLVTPLEFASTFLLRPFTHAVRLVTASPVPAPTVTCGGAGSAQARAPDVRADEKRRLHHGCGRRDETLGRHVRVEPGCIFRAPWRSSCR